MPEDNNKSRREINFEKRDAFYNQLKHVSFDFNINELVLTGFIQRFGVQLRALMNICSTTIPKCKGRFTIKYLKQINESARQLEIHIKDLVNSNGLINNARYFSNVDKHINKLSDILLKTSWASFPALGRRQSTLDYDPTRQKLRKLSQQLSKCPEIFVALWNEHVASWLLNHLNRNGNLDTLKKNGELKLNGVYIETFTRLGTQIKCATRADVVSRWLLNQLSGCLKKFNNIKNFSRLIENLDLITLEIDLEKGSVKRTCDGCKKEFDAKEGETWGYINNGCKDRLCIDCLKRIAADRGGEYKCPKCHRRLNRQWVLDRIEDMS